ncbi:MAG: AAA family ATPase, partial [Ktedonobacteraceae bacterium]|nr:AAA family ATPase [Ktedonobacteraceae bacterium]
MMIPTLHIHLLGDFLLMSDDHPVTAVHTPRLQALLAYLVLHCTAPQARSHLAFLLWPNLTEAQAHANLRKALHRLHQALPSTSQFLHVDRQHLHWQPSRADVSWTLDVVNFEQALTQAKQAEQAQDMPLTRWALERALDLYRGDLLPSCYDEWLLPERERVRQLFLQASERLIGLLAQERDYAAAITAAQRHLRHEPLHETTYRQLMCFYAQRGDRATALRVYHTCVTVLERELAVEPSEATRQAYTSLLRTGTTSPPSPIALSPRSGGTPLVGRKQEWEQLQEAWRRGASGHPHMVILSGEAGIGKTKLAEELVMWVSRQGISTVSARCYATEGRFAYAPVMAWLHADAIQAG